MAEFKKSGKRRNVRKREKVKSDSDEEELSSVVRGEKRVASSNPLKTATCSIKRLKEVSNTFPYIQAKQCTLV